MTCGCQRRQVYDRFAGLKNLRLLDLGHDYTQLDNMETKQYLGHYGGPLHESATQFAGPIRDSLELTLASGLDRLAGLKDLETFEFDAVDHRIEEAELAWMATHWPSLRSIRRLQAEDFDDPMRAHRKLKLKAFMKALRPEVMFTGRF
ncbi:hypothetical protein BGZ47_007372 [Haplosporangium gracile]|nr:hypothetical protein BGZ47_007372 [Haplosporangium gracile]